MGASFVQIVYGYRVTYIFFLFRFKRPQQNLIQVLL